MQGIRKGTFAKSVSSTEELIALIHFLRVQTKNALWAHHVRSVCPHIRFCQAF